jgi:hypothetical protein
MNRPILLVILSALLLSCCKKDDLTVDNSVPADKAPLVTERYYMQSKIDSTWKTYQYSSVPVYESSKGITFSVPLGNGTDHYEININLDDSLPTAELIRSLEGKRIYFDSITSRIPEVRLIENDILYSSCFLNQGGSSMIVYDVTSDGDYQGKNCFLIEGFFSCKIADVSGNGRHTLSNSKFAIRVAGQE